MLIRYPYEGNVVVLEQAYCIFEFWIICDSDCCVKERALKKMKVLEGNYVEFVM